MTLAWLRLSCHQTDNYSFSTDRAVAFITAKTLSQGAAESHCKMLARKRTREFQRCRFSFGIFLPATRSRIARRNFSRSAGLSASRLRFIASATVLNVSNALLLDHPLPAFIGHNLDKIGDGTLL